ncbi:MAG: ribbon-helix-helix domain-containing protein [Micrococcales bacterium]|nr:ribbon-helix-helix domain-containing protein [Micrococcales bacterium]
MTTPSDRDEALARWAADPSAWDAPKDVLTGTAAAAYGRDVLTAAGVDVPAVERAVGRPRVDGGTGTAGVRSPRVNVAISPETDALLAEAGRRQGLSRSALVRQALDAYLRAAV